MAGDRITFSVIARVVFAALASLAVMLGDVSFALAQTQNCSQVSNLLRGIERNPVYVNYTAIVGELRSREAQVREAESIWIRGGCQQAHNAGQALSRDCRTLAQTITSGRTQVQRLTAQARDGQSLGQHREQLLQQYARFSCGAGQSGVGINTQANLQQQQRGGLLDQIFGAAPDGYDYVDGPYNPWSQMSTRRTVCVRTSDGYYWPISFSTVDDYIAQDAIKCHEMCPGAEVLLFSYRNPGEEPEDMISLSGVPYRATPYAFKFREAFDTETSCRPRAALGTIALAGEGQDARAVIAFENMSFPLPQRDPRRTVEAVVAEALYVPLPRPRPREDGTYSPTVSAQPNMSGSDLRIVNFGDRSVRIVGPETPYVPAAAGAS